MTRVLIVEDQKMAQLFQSQHPLAFEQDSGQNRLPYPDGTAHRGCLQKSDHRFSGQSPGCRLIPQVP